MNRESRGLPKTPWSAPPQVTEFSASEFAKNSAPETHDFGAGV